MLKIFTVTKGYNLQASKRVFSKIFTTLAPGAGADNIFVSNLLNLFLQEN
jgi:hypothetical protein